MTAVPRRVGLTAPAAAPWPPAAKAASVIEPARHFTALACAAFDQPTCGIGVFVVDLPGLLEIAETYGEPAREVLLTKIEWRLQRLFGSSAVARTAAMRFSLVLQGVLEQDVPPIVERIQTAVSDRRSGSGLMIVGIPTVGVAISGPTDGRLLSAADRQATASGLVRRAELALQQAQADHPGTYRLYCPELEAALRDRTLLRQALLRAIDRHEFHMAYQPIVDLGTCQTVGLEALIRWHTPPAGISADPGTFIQAAEETGLILPIGGQILAMTTAQIRRWRHRGYLTPRVAINVSGQQLRDRGFYGGVMQELNAAGLKPSAIELELTERTLVDCSPDTIRMLEQLRAIGMEIAVDDFGTGYSSLRYLQDLPISKLKIDRSFISKIGTAARQSALVDAMIGLSAGLGLKVVAEGIETEDQLAILRARGCQAGQGYLFSPPLAVDQAHHCFNQSWAVH